MKNPHFGLIEYSLFFISPQKSMEKPNKCKIPNRIACAGTNTEVINVIHNAITMIMLLRRSQRRASTKTAPDNKIKLQEMLCCHK